MKSRSRVVEPIFCDDEIKASSPQNFGFTFAAVFLVISITPLLKNHSIRIWPLSIATALFFFAVVFPVLLKWPNRLWFLFGQLLQRVTQPVFMAIFFFGFITPAGLLMRVFKSDNLNLKWEKNATSYWIIRDAKSSSELMKHLF